jgi:hypothetical protein
VLGAVCDGTCVGPSYVGGGDACDVDARCPYASECLAGSCRAAVGLGEACEALVPCDSGGRCDDGTCAPLIEPGEACTASRQCVSGLCTDGRCVSLPSACVAAP